MKNSFKRVSSTALIATYTNNTMAATRWFLRIIVTCLALASIASAGKDFYKVLGVAKDCDERTLKKMYHKLALHHHPDKGGSEEKFREISEAYDVLSDTEKRKVYDQYGEEGLKRQEQGGHPGGGGGGFGHGGGHPFGGGGFGHGQQFQFNFGGPGGGGRGSGGGGRDPFDMFNDMFGGQGGPRGRGGGQQQPERSKENLFDRSSPVTSLRHGKFPGTDSKYVWLIEYYVPWCGHCKQMKPILERMATELKGFIKVGAVNCEKEKSLCNLEGVHQYPVLKIKKGSTTVTYDGERQMEAIRGWSFDQLPNAVVGLRKLEHLDKYVSTECVNGKLSASGACFLHLSETPETPAWIKAASHAVRGKSATAESKGTNEAIASRLDAVSFPGLFVICGGDLDRTAVYSGDLGHTMTPDKVEAFFTEYAEKEGCKRVLKVPKVGLKLEKGFDYSKLRVNKLKSLLAAHNIPCVLCMEKSDFVRAIENHVLANSGESEL